MSLQTNCATFEGRREPRRQVRRILNRTSRDRRRRGSRLVRLFKTAKLRCGVQMFRATRSSADNRQIITIFYNKFCLQRGRSTTYAKRAADCKLARLTCHLFVGFVHQAGGQNARHSSSPQLQRRQLRVPEAINDMVIDHPSAGSKPTWC